MKRNLIIASSFIIAFALAVSTARGQEKKSEQKIKIVMSDGSGETIVLDTVMTGLPQRDSIKLKNGKTVYIGHAEGDLVGSKSSSGKVYVYTHADTDVKTTPDGHKTLSWVSADTGEGEKKVVIIAGDEAINHVSPDNNMVFIQTDKMKHDSEKTKYVISRDGLVISVEGNDYDKVKKIVDEIEARLDADKPAAAKTESTKDQKKK